jgi:hypothetical protein
MYNATNKVVAYERNIVMTKTNASKKRKLNFRHIGWACSWGLFYFMVFPCTMYSMILWFATGNSWFQDHPIIEILCLIAAAWNLIRNKVGIREYLNLYKKGLR